MGGDHTIGGGGYRHGDTAPYIYICVCAHISVSYPTCIKRVTEIERERERAREKNKNLGSHHCDFQTFGIRSILELLQVACWLDVGAPGGEVGAWRDFGFC